jgi:hypothetical protein
MGPNGFGGTLAAPIWRAYMEAASGGYCGAFPPPTTPWSGTAYYGAHSSGSVGSYHNGTGTGSGTGTGGVGGSGTSTSSTPYNNPTLFAQPTTPSGSGGTAPATGGSGGGGSGGSGSPGNSGHAPGHSGGGKTH